MFIHKLYTDDLEACLNSIINIQKLRNKSILISGATGMIGSFLVDAIMHGNSTHKLNCTVIALGRNTEKAKQRFSSHQNKPHFIFIQHDINNPLPLDTPTVDYIIHSASTTHPIAYATTPISTITTNIFGTFHLLEYLCRCHNHARLILTSSVEIYGQNRGDIEYFDETYCGYIDCNTLRAGYPESKRLSESLCQAFVEEKGIDYVTARLPRVYGPTMLMNDSKALSQFIKKGLAQENIILKSQGEQFFSYIYVADAASALLSIMLSGNCGAAYNIADSQSDITLRDLAHLVANLAGTSIHFELPDSIEASGFSTATKAAQNPFKLHKLGWRPTYDINTGIEHTLEILKSQNA